MNLLAIGGFDSSKKVYGLKMGDDNSLLLFNEDHLDYLKGVTDILSINCGVCDFGLEGILRIKLGGQEIDISGVYGSLDQLKGIVNLPPII